MPVGDFMGFYNGFWTRIFNSFLWGRSEAPVARHRRIRIAFLQGRAQRRLGFCRKQSRSG